MHCQALHTDAQQETKSELKNDANSCYYMLYCLIMLTCRTTMYILSARMVADCAAAVREEDHQDEDGKVDDDVELGPDTVEEEEELEGQDDLDDDELQSMLQNDDDSPGAITDTANTDWYLHSYTAANCSTANMYHLWYATPAGIWY